MNQFPVIIERLSESFLLNCQLFGVTLLFAIPFGLLIAFGSMSKFQPLRWFVRTFVWMIRGTPLMLQLIIIFYGPGLIGLAFSWPNGSTGRFVAAAVAFSPYCEGLARQREGANCA